MPAPYRRPPTIGSGTATAKAYQQSRTAILVPVADGPLAVLHDDTFRSLVRRHGMRNGADNPVTELGRSLRGL
jgi:hypothetical protein